MDRAITNPAVWSFAYAMLVAAEGVTFVLLAASAIAMLRALRGPAVAFNHSKRWMIAGATMGFAVWFLGFMVVGGEFFAMWQSKTWNGQEAAFRFYMTLLAVQPDADPA